jgi:hypothetical protein
LILRNQFWRQVRYLDLEKQEKIINLIPKIRKYYSFNNIKAVGEPEKIKRPWLSIIKQLYKFQDKLK